MLLEKTAEVPLTEHQLDKLLDKLDMDGDGEVDFRYVMAAVIVISNKR